MKQLMLLIFVATLFLGCADSKKFTINGRETLVQPYGWANAEAVKNDSVVYQVSAGNVVWSILLSETIIAPVYFTGWSIMEPVKLANDK